MLTVLHPSKEGSLCEFSAFAMRARFDYWFELPAARAQTFIPNHSMKRALIATLFDEADNVSRWWDCLRRQTVRPDEIDEEGGGTAGGHAAGDESDAGNRGKLAGRLHRD
jgi:hypothetical protein